MVKNTYVKIITDNTENYQFFMKGLLTLKLDYLLSKLGKGTIKIINGNTEEISIKGCKLISSKQVAFSSEVLYFATTNDLPKIPENIIITVLFRNEASIPFEYKETELVNLLIPLSNIPADVLFNQLCECLLEDDIIVSSSLRLMDSLFSDFGLQHVVDVAYEITGHHIYVVDNSYRYLAISHKESVNAFENPTLALENELGYISDEGVNQIKKINLDEIVRKAKRPYYFKNTVLGSGTLIDIIRIHNVEIGHIMMFESKQPFTNLDKVIITRLSSIISLELQKSNLYKKNRGIMYSYFLADLLKNGTSNYKTTVQRLNLLGFTLNEKLFIMVVDLINDRVKNELHLEEIAEQLHWILVENMYVIYQNRVVILISRADTGIKDFEYKNLEKYVLENSLVVGISNCFLNIQEIQRHYNQAVKTVEIGYKLEQKSAVYQYKDLSVMHMFSICNEKEDILNFCCPELLILVEYDRINSTELTHTLYEYIMSLQKSVKAATVLYIHKNTLLYRIDKIKTIIGNDLESGEIIARLHLSYKILSYLKKI